MAEGVGFPFPSLLFNEGRTYGQPEVVRISLSQVATGLRLRLPGSFRRRGFQPDLLMPQEALLRKLECLNVDPKSSDSLKVRLIQENGKMVNGFLRELHRMM